MIAKKIIFVIVSMAGGGAERVISILANQMAKHGLDVSIMMTAEKEKKSVYPLDERITLLPMGKATGGSLKGRLLRLRRMRAAFLEHRDAVIVSFGPGTTFFTVAADLFLKHTMLVSERNDPAVCTYPKLRNIVYNRANHLIFQTNDAMECFPRGLRQKGEVIPNPVAASLPEPFYGEREKTVVCVGRFEPQKNHFLLLEAFAAFVEKFPEYRLHLYGEGSLRGKLMQRMDELGIAKKIVFEGFVSNVPERIRKAGMYVLSSDYEGISNSLLEAMAVGLPVISTDCPIGGSKVCISSGENGILVKTKDAAALQEAMSAIAADEAFAKRLGRNAAKLRILYSEEQIGERWIRAIEQTVKYHRTNL